VVANHQGGKYQSGMISPKPDFRCWHQAAIKLRPLFGRDGWKADFEQAASVIVLCARQGASLRQRRSGPGAIRSLFQLMGRDTAYWYRRGRGCLWAKAGSRL
jgi:hypothetical protein